MAAPAKEKGLIPGFEATLDAHFEAMVSDETFKVPGVVVLARRGKDTYVYIYRRSMTDSLLNLKWSVLYWCSVLV